LLYIYSSTCNECVAECCWPQLRLARKPS